MAVILVFVSKNACRVQSSTGHFFRLNKMINYNREIYEPQEDSYLLKKCVTPAVRGRVLDLGTGSGIQALAAAENSKVREVVAVDINPEAVKRLQQKHARKLHALQSDLFENVEGQFNVIIFNPPYLPQDKGITEPALYGGKKGWEIAERFFQNAAKYLLPDGKILFLFSTLTNKKKIEEIISRYLFSFKEIANEKLSFEELFVYEVTKTTLLRQLEARGLEEMVYFAKGKRGMVYRGKLNLNQRIKLFIPSRKKYIEIAVKVKRKESQAGRTISKEAFWLKKVNRLGIGPKLLFELPEQFVATEFIAGDYLPDWLKKHDGNEGKTVLADILEQCFLLDQNNISKEEMHHPNKHIIVIADQESLSVLLDDYAAAVKPVLIDFERCHETTKPQNVTQFVEYICRLKSILDKKSLKINLQQLRKAARDYKTEYSREKFEKILNLF